MVDLAPFKEFTKWLPKLIAGRDPMAPLFDFTAGMWGQMVTRVLANLQIDRKFVLYLLRHSGASNDAFHKRRTIQEIKRRGRWLSDRSVRRYEKSGRLSEQLASLSITQRGAALQALSALLLKLGNFYLRLQPVVSLSASASRFFQGVVVSLARSPTLDSP